MLVYLFIYEYSFDSYILQNYLHGSFCQMVHILFLTFVVLNFTFVGIESLNQSYDIVYKSVKLKMGRREYWLGSFFLTLMKCIIPSIAEVLLATYIKLRNIHSSDFPPYHAVGMLFNGLTK